ISGALDEDYIKILLTHIYNNYICSLLLTGKYNKYLATPLRDALKHPLSIILKYRKYNI
ncbi:hypothetical protein ACJX0J_013914, partial [Zea mays]